MPHTVALLAPNGRVGAAALVELVKSHQAGKIDLVVLHRVGSPPKVEIPNTVSVREVDLEGEPRGIEQAVKGINTLVSALASEALALQIPLVEAFAKSPDAITFIPSQYGDPSHPEELAENPALEQVMAFLTAGWRRAEELGLGVTKIHAGLFDEYCFAAGVTDINLKQNTVQANDAQLKNKFAISSMPYIGAGIAEIASRPPTSIKGQAFSLVEFWPTGQEIVDLVSKINNGTTATVLDYTPADREAELAVVPHGAIKAGAKGCWARGKWGYAGEFRPEGFASKSLLEVASQWK